MNNSEHKERIIIGNQLKKARELLQLTPEEVAIEISTSPKDIVNWEQELTTPNLKYLEELSKLYGREVDYFLRETPNPPTEIEFRGKPGESLRNLSKDTKIVLARFDELCRNAVEFEELLDTKREVKISPYSSSEPLKKVSKDLREKYNLKDKPIINLRELLEHDGIRIFELPIPNDEISGFSFWHSKYGPCILINANEIKGRKNFTLSHELAHLLYGHKSSVCYIPSKIGEISHGIEYKANQFAIELLLPEFPVVEDFKKRGFSKRPSEKELRQISYKWGVSIQALGYRLENLGLIEKGHIDTLLETKQFFKGKKGPRTPKWEKQLGKQFVETSIETCKKKFISIGKLANVLGIPIRKAFEIVEQ